MHFMMPSHSALITRSSSSNPKKLRFPSRTQIPASSNRSSRTAPSPKLGPSWSWGLKDRVRSLFTQRRLINAAELSSGSDGPLTEDSLREHNRRHEYCSPYYKGLTDSSLAINQYRVVEPTSPGRNRYRVAEPTSPGRESHATTVRTSTTSMSSFIIKMKEFGSCMSMNTKKTIKNNNLHGGSAAPTTTMLKEIGNNTIPKDSGRTMTVVKEKPLRERVSEQQEQIARKMQLNATIRNGGSVKNQKEVGVQPDTTSCDSDSEFVWASRYRPKALKDFLCNRDIAISLQGKITKDDGDCGHFIFQGQPGVGKRTMIWAMLREFFGADKVQTREERKMFELKGESGGSIEVNVRESTHHVEVSVAELKGYEKHIIVELIKETDIKLSETPYSQDNCRAIILYEADRLSCDALLYIKWLLEKYKNTKVFFCCVDVSKLQPIRNLCSVLQLNPPSREEIVSVLEFIAEQEGIHLPKGLAEKFADSSKNNLRQAIRSFEATWHKSYPFKEDQVILSGWDDDIAMIAKNIIEEQSPKQLYKIRMKLLTLFEHDVCPNFIFETLVQELKKPPLTETLQQLVDCLYAEYTSDQSPGARTPDEEMEKRLHDPLRRNFQHLLSIEEFIARFMSSYKTYHKTRIKDDVPQPGPA